MPKGSLSKFGDCGSCSKQIGNNARKVLKCTFCNAWWHELCVRKHENDPQKDGWRCTECVQLGDLSVVEPLTDVEAIAGIQVDIENVEDQQDVDPVVVVVQEEALPSCEEAHKKNIPTATHIPKSARGDFARALADVFWNIVNSPQDINNHIKLQIFPRCILRAKSDGEEQSAQSYAAEVKCRLRRWMEGDILSLWKEAVKSLKKGGKRGRRKKSKVSDKEQQEKQNATTHYSQPTTHNPIPTIHYPYPLSTTHYHILYLLSTTHYSQPTTHNPLPTIHYPLPTIHQSLPTIH